MKVHFIIDTGYFEPHVDSICGLGDSYSRGIPQGTIKKKYVSCKKCLKILKADNVK